MASILPYYYFYTTSILLLYDFYIFFFLPRPSIYTHFGELSDKGLAQNFNDRYP